MAPLTTCLSLLVRLATSASYDAFRPRFQRSKDVSPRVETRDISLLREIKQRIWRHAGFIVAVHPSLRLPRAYGVSGARPHNSNTLTYSLAYCRVPFFSGSRGVSTRAHHIIVLLHTYPTRCHINCECGGKLSPLFQHYTSHVFSVFAALTPKAPSHAHATSRMHGHPCVSGRLPLHMLDPNPRCVSMRLVCVIALLESTRRFSWQVQS